MQLQESKIIEQVRLRLDEIRLNESDFDGTIDETDLDLMIKGLAPEAMRFVISNASVELLEPDVTESSLNPSEKVTYKVDEVLVPGHAVGVFIVPSDFLRLVKARNSCWRKDIYEAVGDTDTTWSRLMDAYLTGIPEDPAVGIKTAYTKDESSWNNVEIILFSIDKNNTSLSTISYMVDPQWENGAMRVSRYLTEPFYYYLASLILIAMGDNRSQNAQQKALALMGAETQGTS